MQRHIHLYPHGHSHGQTCMHRDRHSHRHTHSQTDGHRHTHRHRHSPRHSRRRLRRRRRQTHMLTLTCTWTHIQFSSVAQSCPTRCDPMNCSTPGLPAHHQLLPMNTQDWFPLGWTGWISLQSKGLSRVFSNTTVQKHQFFGAQLSLRSSSHIRTWLLEEPQPWPDGPLMAQYERSLWGFKSQLTIFRSDYIKFLNFLICTVETMVTMILRGA